MINDAGKHEVKKVLRDRCTAPVSCPLLVHRLRRSQTLAACSDACVEFQELLTPFLILVRFFAFELPKRDRGSTALAGQIGFSGIAGVGASIAAAGADWQR
jgi:hypothetical protein